MSNTYVPTRPTQPLQLLSQEALSFVGTSADEGLPDPIWIDRLYVQALDAILVLAVDFPQPTDQPWAYLSAEQVREFAFEIMWYWIHLSI